MIAKIRNKLGDEIYSLIILTFSITSLLRLNIFNGFPGVYTDGFTIGLLFGELSPIIYALLIWHSLTVFFKWKSIINRKSIQRGSIIAFAGLTLMVTSGNLVFIRSMTQYDMSSNIGQYLNDWSDGYSHISSGLIGSMVRQFSGIWFKDLLLFPTGMFLTLIGTSIIITGNAFELFINLIQKLRGIEIEKKKVVMEKEEIHIKQSEMKINPSVRRENELTKEIIEETNLFIFLDDQHKIDRTGIVKPSVAKKVDEIIDMIDSKITGEDELSQLAHETTSIDMSLEQESVIEVDELRDIEQSPLATSIPAPLVEQNNKLANVKDDAQKVAALEVKERIIETFKIFGINIEINNYSIGPAITKYEITLEMGTKVSQLTKLTADLKLALGVKELRIESPIPGKRAIGIEVPNKIRSQVLFSTIFKEIKNKLEYNKMEVILGKDIDGVNVTCDLSKMPHLLIAGATGSGKSVCLSVILSTLILNAKPSEIKLVLIDPKRVEFNLFKGVAHLASPVITDIEAATVALDQVVAEMERRYEILQKCGFKNIESYNLNNNDNKIAKIVVVIDEFADLMMNNSHRVERQIQRLAQMARAAGIHLVLATQRPTTDVITGTIKANIPSRISFAVSSSIDSRTIIDQTGAEKLIGRGDMLYSPMESNHPVRIQGAIISDDEVFQICELNRRSQH